MLDLSEISPHPFLSYALLFITCIICKYWRAAREISFVLIVLPSWNKVFIIIIITSSVRLGHLYHHAVPNIGPVNRSSVGLGRLYQHAVPNIGLVNRSSVRLGCLYHHAVPNIGPVNRSSVRLGCLYHHAVPNIGPVNRNSVRLGCLYHIKSRSSQ